MVERSLSMREAGGSMPPSSRFFVLLKLFAFSFCFQGHLDIVRLLLPLPTVSTSPSEPVIVLKRVSAEQESSATHASPASALRTPRANVNACEADGSCALCNNRFSLFGYTVPDFVNDVHKQGGPHC
jgi:hypothetical protein